MNTRIFRSGLVLLTLATTGVANADDPQTKQDKPGMQGKQDKPGMQGKQDKPAQTPSDMQSSKTADAAKSKIDSAEAMKLSQTALTHIRAAETALDQKKTSAAKAALAKSERALSRLYDTPALVAVLNEFDEALNALSGKKPALEALDLAPLATSVTTYQEYLDPEVAAGIKEAQDKAKAGDAQATEEALRLARNRVAVEVALLPVEEAYVRVLAAQQALQKGNTKAASRLIRNVPVVISEVQISRPLVPIRFNLHAAAEAAEARQWDRARALLDEANLDVQRLETLSANTPIGTELTAIADEVERMTRQAKAGSQPDAKQIREIAKRTRDIGELDEQDKRG